MCFYRNAYNVYLVYLQLWMDNFLLQSWILLLLLRRCRSACHRRVSFRRFLVLGIEVFQQMFINYECYQLYHLDLLSDLKVQNQSILYSIKNQASYFLALNLYEQYYTHVKFLMLKWSNLRKTAQHFHPMAPNP